MCQAYEGERAFLQRIDKAKAKKELEKLIERSKNKDEPSKEEWSKALATFIIESEQ